MSSSWQIRIGEIGLKKRNRPYFESILKNNIKTKFREESQPVSVRTHRGRFYLETDSPDNIVIRILSSTPGHVGFSRIVQVRKDLDELTQASVRVARQYLAEGAGTRFKFEVRRADKSLPLDSYGYARELGGRLLAAVPELTVDVRRPDFVIRVELRDQAYVCGREYPGPRGLPAGSSGKGMLLLSGGIDSPVAGFMMARRGMTLNAVHFHTPPFTSPEAHDKVMRLAAVLAPWCGGLNVYSVDFSACQTMISQTSEPAAVTLHSRACMTQIAGTLAAARGCGILITGEALGQVASQTLESLTFTDSMAPLPVFRPLIGHDKENIISMAEEINTFGISTEPFDDCCVIFSPDKPLTRPDTVKEQLAYDSIKGLDELKQQAAEQAVRYRFSASGKRI